MDSKNQSSHSLRDLFDEVLELAPDLRHARLMALDLPEDLRNRVQTMVAFNELLAVAAELREAKLSELDLPNTVSAKVRSMLSADSQIPVFLRATATLAVDQLEGEAEDQDEDEALAQSLVGTKIGTFQLRALIGQGGSSIVFRAVRQAGDGAQVVAVKLLRTGLYSAGGQRRFRREQAILAQLTHPNIASLIEGGVSDSGIPYIAMELVDGVPITLAANERQLDIRQRLIWFSGLCRAIEAAHAALIVHRDLKPSNLLVTNDGTVKVVDFGIAKLVEHDEASTRTQSVSFTCQYAAPEQFSSTALTTAVDIYALGVVFGELLTGKRLHSGARASSSVASGTDALPTGLPARALLVRKLRGDIDSILTTAIADEPAMRYHSAAAFADDIDRYLAGEPLRAHPPSQWYRAKKFIVRHRNGIAVLSLLLTGILCSLGVAVWQGVQARRAATLAQAQVARAESMRSFMFNAFAEAEPDVPRKSPTTVVEVVEHAITTASEDRTLDPRARIELLTRLAEVIGAQGDLERSGKLLADAHAQAIALLGDGDALTFEIAALIERNHLLRNELSVARAEVDTLLAHPAPRSLESLSRLYRDSAVIASKVHETRRAMEDGRKQVDTARLTENPDLIAESLSDFGNILLSADEVAQAIGVYEEVLTLSRARFGEQNKKVASILSGLARAYRRAFDFEKSEAYAQSALAIDRAIYPADHYVIANHLNALSITLLYKRDLARALDAADESLRINRITFGERSDEVGTAMQVVASVHIRMENYAKALPLLRRALSDSIKRDGEHHWATTVERADYGYALVMSGSAQEGIALIDTARADLEALKEPDPAVLSTTLEKRIRLALFLSAPSDAAKFIDQLAGSSHGAAEESHYWDGRIDCLRGEILMAQGQATQAMSLLARCGERIDAQAHPEVVIYVEQRLLHATAAAAVGDLPEARKLAAEGRARLKNLPYPPSRLLALESKLPH